MTNKQNPWKKLASKISFTTPYYVVREDDVLRPDGKPGKYYVLDVPPSVFIVALTNANEVYLVGLYRYTTDMYSWELPAGSADSENMLEGAKRELQEETGLVCDDWQQLGKLQAFNGKSNNFQYVFLARDVNETPENKQQEEGIKEVKEVSFAQALKMIDDHEITDSESIAALILAGLRLKLI